MLECLSPGLLATIQDPGRHGMQSLGVGVSGAMDVFALRVANALLGNPDAAPALEITSGGTEFVAHGAAWFALSGADIGAVLDGVAAPLCAPFRMSTGQRIRFSGARRGQRAYLAVAGGFAADLVFGSAATDLRGGFGGFRGRGLERGDRLHAPPERITPRVPARVFTSLAHPGVVSREPLALLPGPAFAQLSTDDQERLLHADFTVSRVSDRMGVRLEESLPSAANLPQVLSAPVVFGTLQLPPDGRGILLGADRQTTGGYPVAGVVAGIDHGRLAQARPGDRLRFRAAGLAEARAAWQSRERQLAQLRLAASVWWRENA